MNNPSTSTILKGITIQGEIQGKGNIRIEGKVDGEIKIGGLCIVEQDGEVKGNITSTSATISGTVFGNITSTDRLEVRETGHIEGDISVPRILIADGASVNGNVTVGESAGK